MLRNYLLILILLLLTGCGVVKKDTVGSTDPVDYGSGTYVFSQSHTLSLKGNIDNRELATGTVYYSEKEDDGIYNLVASGVWTGELENSSVTFNPSGQHVVQIIDLGLGTSNYVIRWAYDDENNNYYQDDYDALTYNALTNTIDGLVGVTLNFTDVKMDDVDIWGTGFHTAGETYALGSVNAYDSLLNKRRISFWFNKLSNNQWFWSAAGQGIPYVTGNITVESDGSASGDIQAAVYIIGINGSESQYVTVDLSEITFTNADTNLYQGETSYEGTRWEHVVSRYPDGSEKHTYFEYYYDDDGNLIKGVTIYSSGARLITEYRIDGSEKYVAHCNREGILYSEVWYDLEQRMIKSILRDQAGYFDEWREYVYDPDGQLISTIQKDEGGNILRQGRFITTEVEIGCNLSSNSVIGDIFSFDVDVYDSLLAKRTITIIFELVAENQWDWIASGVGVGGTGIIYFNNRGQVLDVSNTAVSIMGMNGAASQTVDFNFRDIIMFPFQSHFFSYKHD